MATEVYKAGESVERFGIKCDVALVQPEKLNNYLEAGYKLHPSECYESAESEEKPRRGRPPKSDS